MKVLFVCENYLPHFGGVEVVFKNISERILKKGNSPPLLTHQLEGTKKKNLLEELKFKEFPPYTPDTFLLFPPFQKLSH